MIEAVRIWGLVGGLGSRSRRALGSVAVKKIDEENLVFESREKYMEALKSMLGKFSDIADEQNYPPYTALSSLSMLRFFGTFIDARTAHKNLGRIYKKFRGQSSNLRGRQKIPFGIPLQQVTEERRSSPLFFHIHPVGEKFMPVVLYIPGKFHPDFPGENENLHDFYKVVRDFMEDES
jgi:CRISPR-associated protein Cmr1